MMPVFGQVRKLSCQQQTFIVGMKTSRAAFPPIWCRYSDSFIDMYHVVSGLMIVRQQLLIRWRLAGELRHG
jgi:hypothetical protein